MSFYFGKPETRKKEFVGFRCEPDLFQELNKKAESKGSDVSSTIRELCREGLKKNAEESLS